MSRERTKVELPSGRAVWITAVSDSARPWEVHGDSDVRTIARPRRGDSSRDEPLREAGRVSALVLSEADALALLTVLRGRVSARAR